MSNKKLIIGVIIFALIGMVLIIGMKMVEEKNYVAEKYYNEIFDSAITIYGEVSTILLYDTQEEIDSINSIKDKVKKVSNNIESLATNSKTKDGERIIAETIKSANKAIELQKEKISGSDTYNFKDSHNAIDSIEAGLKEIEKVMNKKEIEFAR